MNTSSNETDASKMPYAGTSKDDMKLHGGTVYIKAVEVPFTPRRMSVEEQAESIWFQNLIKRERNPDGPNSSKALFESAKSSQSPWFYVAQELERQKENASRTSSNADSLTSSASTGLLCECDASRDDSKGNRLLASCRSESTNSFGFL